MPGTVDGFKIDAAGNIVSSAPGGVFVISQEGTLLGRVETGERTANIAWGPDGSTVYVTMHAYICRIRTNMRAAVIP
jgi:gluconolactonase